MAYEIDFIGVGSEVKKDADAISFRWKDEFGQYKVAVYDGGLQIHGERLEEHLNQYYFNGAEEKIIDCVICSHSDLDHASGLKNVLENFDVKILYMNRPWLYIDDIWDKVNDDRITKASLERRLKEQYKYVQELEQIALDKGIDVREAFQGTVIYDKLTILSPSKSFYLQLLIESNKTPLSSANESSIFHALKSAMQYVKNLFETWTHEELRENVITSAENEMSIIIYGNIDDKFLLTGDAGIRALDESISYFEKTGLSIKNNIGFIQIPHHGGRHNVSPSILNRLIGGIVKEGIMTGKTAFVSAAKDSDHPLQMVVNAFTRRGVKVYKTNGNVICHQQGMGTRAGWVTVKQIEFHEEVEDWEN